MENGKKTLLNIVNTLDNLSKNREVIKQEKSIKDNIVYSNGLKNNLVSLGKSKDISSILKSEEMLIIADIELSKKDNSFKGGTKTSLETALKDLTVALEFKDVVTNKEEYLKYTKGVSSKNIDRINGLPRDIVHRFIDSNKTRLSNSIVAPKIPKYEKDVLYERNKNMTVVKEKYMKQQAKTLGVELKVKGKSKDKERD